MRRSNTGPIPANLRPTLSPELAEAMEIYNTMGGLDWTAIPIMVALFNVRDPMALVIRLAIIRDAVKSDG